MWHNIKVRHICARNTHALDLESKGLPKPQTVTDPDNLDLVQLVRGLLQASESDIYQKASEEFDRVMLREVLRHVKGHQVHASEILGMSRNTLRAKLRALGMAFEKYLSEPEHDGQKLPPSHD
jgi:DNA-binding protein Fis